jgi:L-asparaginase type II
VVALGLAAALVTPLGATVQDTLRPRVLILTTGGTIASRPEAPMIEGPALVQSVPELLEHADVEVDEVFRIGSSKMMPENWLQLARRINERLRADGQLAGIVVTHGTDTMEETAYFLTLTVRDRRPVVLTGSMRGATEVSADGPANLLNAVRVAVSPQAAGRGVLVALNEEVHSARAVRKTDNRRVQTFDSGEMGLVGHADPDSVVFYRRPARRHTVDAEFRLDRLASLPRVDLFTDYTGYDGATVDFVVTRGAQGIVIASFAGRRMSAGAVEAARRAAQSRAVVVVASRIPASRAAGGSLGPEDSVVEARDLSPQKARILLMLALTVTDDVREVQRIFDTY